MLAHSHFTEGLVTAAGVGVAGVATILTEQSADSIATNILGSAVAVCGVLLALLSKARAITDRLTRDREQQEAVNTEQARALAEQTQALAQQSQALAVLIQLVQDRK